MFNKFVSRIYGSKAGNDGSLFLLRLKLTPKTRWGRLFLHVFMRGDQDPEPHDHPWDFWTFPLVTYKEEYIDVEDCQRYGAFDLKTRFVRRFHLHHRVAEHVHRVLDPLGRLPIISLVWHGPRKRAWGFWVGWRWVSADQYLNLPSEITKGVR